MSGIFGVIAICAFIALFFIGLCHDLGRSMIYKKEVCERLKERGESGLIMGKYFMKYDCYREDRKWVFYIVIFLYLILLVSVIAASTLKN